MPFDRIASSAARRSRCGHGPGCDRACTGRRSPAGAGDDGHATDDTGARARSRAEPGAKAGSDEPSEAGGSAVGSYPDGNAGSISTSDGRLFSAGRGAGARGGIGTPTACSLDLAASPSAIPSSPRDETERSCAAALPLGGAGGALPCDAAGPRRWSAPGRHVATYSPGDLRLYRRTGQSSGRQVDHGKPRIRDSAGTRAPSPCPRRGSRAGRAGSHHQADRDAPRAGWCRRCVCPPRGGHHPDPRRDAVAT